MSDLIGPAIPSHLLNRYPTATKEDPDTSDDADDADNSPVAGPQIPPGIHQNCSEPKETPAEYDDDDDDEPDAYAPALPPELLAARRQAPAPTSARRRRVPAGPAMPPGFGRAKEEEGEEDIIIGPAVPENLGNEEDNLSSKIAEIEERAMRARKQIEEPDQDTSTSAKLERGEWMLVPPEVKFLGGVDITSARSFSKKTVDPSKIDSSGWTETPADREKRLREGKATGKRKKEVEEDEPIKYSKADLETKERVERHNATHRAQPLMDMHKTTYVKSRAWEKEDVSKRGFDRERDVVGSRRMDGKKKQEIVEKSKELGTRFGHGRSGTFL